MLSCVNFCSILSPRELYRLYDVWVIFHRKSFGKSAFPCYRAPARELRESANDTKSCSSITEITVRLPAPENSGLFLRSWSQHCLMMPIICSQLWGFRSGIISTQGLLPCDTCKRMVVIRLPGPIQTDIRSD